jgi:ParB family chromosome partitioning protein
MAKKRGLGRSLEALLTKPSATGEKYLPGESTLESPKERLTFLPLGQLQRGKYQPRRDLHPESLQELAESIRAQGIIQPLVVRQLANSQPYEQYEIIAGERRWRAAELAGLTEIPVIIRDLADDAAMAIALIENIQRESLNPIEEADALQKLIDEFKMTHQQVAEAVGKSRTSITNSLRLLTLSAEVKNMVEAGHIEMGHGRALLSLTPAKQLEAARTIAHQGLSVRQAEKLVQQLQAPPSSTLKKPIDPDLKRLQDNLGHRLGLRVNIEPQTKGKGKVVIHYNSLTEFDNLMALLPE